MKRQFVFGTVVAAALTVGLGAQSPSPQDYPQSSKPQSTSQEKGQRTGMQETGRGQMVTVVGCFQSGDATSGAAATGTAGTVTGSGKPSRSMSERGTASTTFKLTEVRQSSTEKSGATGTAGATGIASIPSTVQLMASGHSSANWSRYLNHRVEVKGTFESALAGTESSPGAAAPGANPPSTTPPAAFPSTPPSTANPAGSPSSMMSSGTGAALHVVSIKEISGTCSGSSIK
jgi:hypothetical protein